MPSLMRIHTIHRRQFLPIEVEDAWRFFSSPRNLAKITPPDMHFKVVSCPSDTDIWTGMRISYTLRPIWNIPAGWTTLIQEVDAPHSFVDTQEKGPYALWHHKHTFEPSDGGTMMTDEVRYALPLGILGDIAHALLVKKRVEHIFDHRYIRLQQMFGMSGNKG